MTDRIPVKLARLHSALTIGGMNLRDTVDLTKFNPKGVRMEYDRDNKELMISCNGETAIVPVTNVASMVEGQPADVRDITPPNPAEMGKITAQVSTPQSHVFEGLGKGKTGRDK